MYNCESQQHLLPAMFNGSVSFDHDDTKGELDFFIADLFPPLTALPDGAVVYVTLEAADSPDSVEALVQFSSEPPVSFGSTSGQSIVGTISNGSVLITSQGFQLYLPGVLSTINERGLKASASLVGEEFSARQRKSSLALNGG